MNNELGPHTQENLHKVKAENEWLVKQREAAKRRSKLVAMGHDYKCNSM